MDGRTSAWCSSSRSDTGWKSSRDVRAMFAIICASFQSFFCELSQMARSLRAFPTMASHPQCLASELIHRQWVPVSIATVAPACSLKNAPSVSLSLLSSHLRTTLPRPSSPTTLCFLFPKSSPIVISLFMAVLLVEVNLGFEHTEDYTLSRSTASHFTYFGEVSNKRHTRTRWGAASRFSLRSKVPFEASLLRCYDSRTLHGLAFAPRTPLAPWRRFHRNRPSWRASRFGTATGIGHSIYFRFAPFIATAG